MCCNIVLCIPIIYFWPVELCLGIPDVLFLTVCRYHHTQLKPFSFPLYFWVSSHMFFPSLIYYSLQIGRLHCLLPWWEDATVNFMITGGYNVLNQIKQVLFYKHPNYYFIRCSHMLNVAYSLSMVL